MDWIGLLGIPATLLAAAIPQLGEWRRSQMLERDATVIAALPFGEVKEAYVAQFEQRARELVELRHRRAQPWTLKRVAGPLLGVLVVVGGLLILLADALGATKSPGRQAVEFLVSACATIGVLETWRRIAIWQNGRRRRG